MKKKCKLNLFIYVYNNSKNKNIQCNNGILKNNH